MRDNKGRRKGSRNKGYFYRDGRGWFTKDKAQRFVPLTDMSGARIKDKSASEAAKDAYARFVVSLGETPKQSAPGRGVTLAEVCDYYLARAQKESRASTVEKRADTLFDLVYGLPASFRTSKQKPSPADKTHSGFGKLTIAELRPFHLEKWLDAHPNWSDRRTRLQAVKRALNRAAEGGLIAKDHGIRGMKVPKGNARVTYLSPEQEGVLLNAASPALRQALEVLIRTGMRPGCEFSKLTTAHVKDHGERIELRFAAADSKNNKPRIVRITDKAIIEIFRKQVKRYPTGPLFRNNNQGEWDVKTMSRGFRRTLARAKKTITFDKDVCLYSTRHTFAKRMLTGYWTGKPINMELLAAMMGNTPKVCAEHYANILKELSGVDELIWAAC